MHRFLIACSAFALTTLGASAADLSSGTTDYGPAPEQAAGGWASRFGIAFDTYYYDNADNDEGPQTDGWKFGGNVDFAVKGESANGFGAQFDIVGSYFADNNRGDQDGDDWTESYLTGALHLYGRMGDSLLGVFGGYGITQDTGDTDEDQTYWFAGVEGQRTMGSTMLFGQLGYLDGDDEFEEGIHQAGFGRIGARMFTQPNIAYMAALSGAFGQQDNDDQDAWIANVELEAEYGFGDGSTSAFASYEGTFVVFDDTDRNANFHGLMLGLRWRPGMADLQTAYAGGASLDLPSVDRWFAFTANEVE